MAEWSETVRSSVPPWECDTTEHFTIAYYLDRIDQAAAGVADELGLMEHLRAGVFPRRFTLRFTRELRAGDGFHIDSAPIAAEAGLTLGHRVVDSASGEVVTWVKENWPAAHLSAATRAAIERQQAVWDGPPSEKRGEPKSMAGAVATARGRVRPGDLDAAGRFSLAAFVHRFTDAVLQASTAIGMTGEYASSQRRGYSTFELVLGLTGAPDLGAPYLVETGIAHLGSSSIRFLHRMTDPRSGAEYARLGQFGVQLDLDARRPAPLPAEIRARAARLVLPAG